MTPENCIHTINPEGLTAYVVFDWLDGGDYFDDIYIRLYFADDDLNPPISKHWEVTTLLYRRGDKLEILKQEAIDISVKLYDFLIGFRTAYSHESTINSWRNKYESAREEILEGQRTIQDQNGKIRWLNARIQELETDYVKQLEDRIQILETFLNKLHVKIATAIKARRS